ncbi:MAG: hypothetical protein GKR97_09575 [Rhizobiaceae bacterium]|nr:hypothetical protein [Rhizobiaceae bacterium]
MTDNGSQPDKSANWGRAGASATIICSDCPRNGKTLFAKLAADLLMLRLGHPPHIFDTDEPDGSLISHFRDSGQVIDISKTTAQVALFDGMLARTNEHFLIDLSARHFTRFFDIYRDIDFESGAEEAGLDVTVFYLIDRTEASIEAAAELSASIPKTRFLTVRNSAIGDSLGQGRSSDIYHQMRIDREVLLPQLSAEALGMLEHPDFHFDTFIAGKYEHFPFELKAELWSFLEGLYEQRDSVETGSTYPV